MPEVRSIFAVGGGGGEEAVLRLCEGDQFRLEQIVSFGAASAPGCWYDQEWSEWVVLLRGTAALEFGDGTLTLGAGDFLQIPAHLRHRVARTSADAVWIAVHYPDQSGGGPA